MALVRHALLVVTSLSVTVPLARGASQPLLDKLTLIVPSAKGSGWDQLARAMEHALTAAELVGGTEVINIPGDGGLNGLGEFISSRRGDSHALLIGGVTMIRAARTSHSPPSLSETTPIARLTGEFEVIAVRGGPGGSDVRSLDDLAQAYLANPKRLTRVPAVLAQGIDPALVNWRGVFAPPGLSAQQREALTRLMERMVKTALWHAELDRGHWADLYLSGAAFADFVSRESIAAGGRRQQSATGWQIQIWLLRNSYWLAMLTALAIAGLIGFLVWQRRMANRPPSPVPESPPVGAQEAARGSPDHIDLQFEKWGLTAAERDIALLILKGLRHKEIADLRGTSERTVRQQATVMYRKAGINGRTDLAAFFLFDSEPGKVSDLKPTSFLP